MGDHAVTAAHGVHGFPAALTSFIGRDDARRDVAGLLENHRLVTVTGPGGSGKTRLAGEVARQVAAAFADGAWLVELAPVRDPDRLAAAVATALGVRDQPGIPAAESVCRVLAGEARYRLGPLSLPGQDDGADGSEAVALFADRARAADAGFTLDEQTGAEVAELVRRLDGMPLAIELAAARAESLGVGQLLDRLDDRFALLAGADRLAPPRQRSLSATVKWSYQLLGEREQAAFRAVSVFPGAFTLEAAEAVAGPGAGPVVLRLVDCSLVVPPRAGPDGRARYSLLETLRAYGARLLAAAGEQDQADAALAGWAVGVAERAAAGLQSSEAERDAARWLDAEDATMHQVLAWSVARDASLALRWWPRLAGGGCSGTG